jgi:hypothetical protein
MQYGCSCSDWQINYWADEVEPFMSDRRHKEAEDYIENRRREHEEPSNLNRR